ncbi:hypothetical protein K438DRAFT_1927187 [Mycena galopus ATCC 62051]|nr:hypothetical protein K438DRAFT_1927187 [Mycena galopus ATCC 62051]
MRCSASTSCPSVMATGRANGVGIWKITLSHITARLTRLPGQASEKPVNHGWNAPLQVKFKTGARLSAEDSVLRIEIVFEGERCRLFPGEVEDFKRGTFSSLRKGQGGEHKREKGQYAPNDVLPSAGDGEESAKEFCCPDVNVSMRDLSAMGTDLGDSVCFSHVLFDFSQSVGKTQFRWHEEPEDFGEQFFTNGGDHELQDSETGFGYRGSFRGHEILFFRFYTLPFESLGHKVKVWS